MACAEYEAVLLDADDGSTVAKVTAQLGIHLQSCPACREFRERLKKLDVQLSRAVGRPELSADFMTRVMRLPDANPLPVPAGRESRLELAEQQYRSQLERLQRDWRRRRNLRLGVLAGSTGALVALGPSIWKLLPQLYDLASWLPVIDGVHPLLPLGWLMAALAFAWFALDGFRSNEPVRHAGR